MDRLSVAQTVDGTGLFVILYSEHAVASSIFDHHSPTDVNSSYCGSQYVGIFGIFRTEVLNLQDRTTVDWK